MTLSDSSFPPDGEVFELAGTRLRLAAHPHPCVAGRLDSIAAGWERARAENPRLWNGPMYFLSRPRFGEGIVHGDMHVSDFAAFLHWRDSRPDVGPWYAAATAIPVTADGALLAVRMAAHTANAGKVYFPAGAIDATDFTDGMLDVGANMLRELREETGLKPESGWFRGPLLAVTHRRFLCFARTLCLPLSFGEARAAILDHQRLTGEDEAEEVVALRSADLGGVATQSYMAPLLEWHFRARERVA